MNNLDVSSKFSTSYSGNLKPKYNCFTLIELLVIIAIISILSGMLIPALSKARNSAKSISCVGNLRQINTADALYQNDYEYFVPAAYNMTGRVGEPVWCGARAASSGLYDLSLDGFLTPYLQKAAKNASLSSEAAKNALFCPGADVQAFLGGKTGYTGEISTSRTPAGGYGANLSIHGWTNSTMTIPNMSGIMRKAGKVDNPSSIVSFGDSAGLAMGQTFNSYDLYMAIDNATVCFRHNGKANLAWADGHVNSKGPAYIRTDGVAKQYMVGGLATPGWTGILQQGNDFYFNPDSEYANDSGKKK